MAFGMGIKIGRDALLAQTRRVEKAPSCYLKAIDIASRQSAKSLELRATNSLAKLWRRQGKTAEAQRMLAAIYGWFTEGFEAPDLKDAKDLLDELSLY
jgi:predicted ATPase